MRVESAVTSVSWIPSEAVEGVTKLPFELGVGHYDDPPPEVIDSLERLHRAGAFRFANELRAWVEVEDSHIVDHGHAGRGWISSTLLRFGPLRFSFQPTAFPELRSVPVVTEHSVTFEQTTGGRPGVPAPRLVEGKPYVQLVGPIVWTTLRLTIHADGRSQGELIGASAFPRHWVYDFDGRLVAKSGLTNFRHWYATTHGTHSPWGDTDSPVVVTMAETALERELARNIMRGGEKPDLKRLSAGNLLTAQGEPGDELYLVLDGVLEVQVDSERVAEIGPGALVGERAVLEEGRRTATVRALTDCRIAVAPTERIDREALARLAVGHRREMGH
ncbi:MAG TPA: cyclic nucleotide-binding domain-containing protein [Acidimicrobiales bacterium]|nr:cyclic nucleotide-binding domain-containing protein [Acidimicrobiales bacterium]